jgi:hypothetical protein
MLIYLAYNVWNMTKTKFNKSLLNILKAERESAHDLKCTSFCIVHNEGIWIGLLINNIIYILRYPAQHLSIGIPRSYVLEA